MDPSFEPQSSVETLPLLTRLWFAWVCFFRVLFGAEFAAHVWALGAGAAPDRLAPSATSVAPKAVANASPPAASSSAPALQLLALLQREGRLIDFLKQDIAAFSDNDVGAAARIVHDGCRKALDGHARIDPIRSEPEGQSLELLQGYDASEVKLTGQVQGQPPYRGTLRHRGWRATDVSLPVAVAGHNSSILAPAEVEL
ncbi:MAG TPA: DUF2760 domain-containing protein [Polyangiaceae bacterium]|nr:DUF2760 domain-containing protein [Polyangiaceae bacterium]